VTTPNLGLTELANGQANYLNANEAFAIIDALLQTPVISKTLTAAPGSPANGAFYIMASAWTGVTGAAAGKLALYRTGSGWIVITPKEGWKVEVLADGITYRYDGSVWAEWSAGGGSGGMTNPMTAEGDIIVGGSSGSPERLPVGTDGQVLTAVSGSPEWQDPPGGGFTGGTLSSALNEAPAVTLASAATVNIGAATANTIRITGTSAITAFDAIADGAVRRLEFAGALTLTHNAVSLILPTSSNIVTVAGDVAEFRSLGEGNWRCTGYLRADGTPLAGGGGGGLTYFAEAKNTASPNTTTPAVSLSAVVAETNADMVLAAKGTGATIAQVPDNNTSGGAKRGTRATDWQKGRNSSNQVASGAESTISGGVNNTALGMGAVVGGGVANSVSPSYGVCGGGSSNIVSGTSGTISGGSSNTINSGADGGCIPGGSGNLVLTGSVAAAVLGGAGNTASGQYSTVLGGYQAHSRGIYGAEVRASGQFSTQGDAQRGRYILRRSTTNATPLTLGTNGSGGGVTNQVVLPNNSSYAFTGRVVARENATGDCAAWEFTGVIRRGASAATTALVAAVTPSSIAADAGAAAWGLSVTADTSSGALAITVTGEAAHTIRWVADVETVEVVG